MKCRAEYHGPAGNFRCDFEVTEETRHLGDHAADDGDAGRFCWSDAVAVYPHPDRPLPPVGNGSARLGQVGGEHYRKFKIQPWDVWDEYDLDRYLANCVKYLLRAGHKGPRLEDLKKARHYLDKAIEREEAGNG